MHFTKANKHITFLLLISFLFQGTASLIYQVSWEQAIEKIVGSAMPTMALIVSIFMLGMGLGSYLFSKFRLNYHSVWKLYGLSQFFLFILGIIFAGSDNLLFITSIHTSHIQWIDLVYQIRLVLLFLFLMPTAILIGAGFPLLLYLTNACRLNLQARQLYLFNLIGSAIGTALTGFVLLPNLGIAKSTLLAAIIHLISGCLVVIAYYFGKPAESKLFSQNDKPPNEKGVLSAEQAEKNTQKAKTWIFAVAIAGFFNMFLELIFIRCFSLFMTSSISAYCLVLTTTLLALACGTFCQGRKIRANLVISLLFLLGGLSVLFSAIFLSQLPLILINIKFLIAPAISSLSVFICTIFPVALCLGAILPCCFSASTTKTAQPGELYAINLFASVIGCLSGGILAIPFFNYFSNHALYTAFVISAFVLLLASIFIFKISNSGFKMIIWAVPSLLVLLCLTTTLLYFNKYIWNESIITAGLNYLSLTDLKHIKPVRDAIDLPILFYKEGVNSTVSVMTNPKLNIICLKTDGQMEATAPLDCHFPSPSSDESTQIMLAELPRHFCSMDSVFLLGYGAGITANTILRNPQVNTLTVAELESAVISASHFFSNHYPMDKKIQRKIDIKTIDGRSLLSSLNKTYNAIICQAGEPSRTSCGHLYTYEFWQLAKERLVSGGVLCQWLPIYSIDRTNLLTLCRTFLCVFPNTYMVKFDQSAELILLGFKRSNCSLQSKQLPLLADWLNKYDQERVNRCLNTDDFPIVQYRQQKLITETGFTVDNKLEKMIPSLNSISNSFFLKQTY